MKIKKYVILFKNIYKPNSVYGPYHSLDSARFHLYQIFGDDWRYNNCDIIEMQDPLSLEMNYLTTAKTEAK